MTGIYKFLNDLSPPIMNDIFQKQNYSGLPPNQGSQRNQGKSGKFRYNQGKSGKKDWFSEKSGKKRFSMCYVW